MRKIPLSALLAFGLALSLITPVAADSPTQDVSGTWNWTRVDNLAFPAWVAEDVMGIQPEGPITHARCEVAGTMTLVQTGATFSGILMATSQQCVSSGGQLFQETTIFAPTAIEDGRVVGRSLGFRIDAVLIDCRYHATVASVEGALATALKGGGPCLVPGHPQSEIPADPPPGGRSVTRDFAAWRP